MSANRLRFRLRTMLIGVTLISLALAGYAHRQRYLRELRKPWLGTWTLIVEEHELLSVEFDQDGQQRSDDGDQGGYTIAGPNHMTLLTKHGPSRCYYERIGDVIHVSQAQPGDPYPRNLSPTEQGSIWRLERPRIR